MFNSQCSIFMRYLPNLLEYAVLLALAYLSRLLFSYAWLTGLAFEGMVVLLAWGKTAWFVLENSRQVIQATAKNLPYHRFLSLMGVNMSQISLSFALDFYCLQRANPGSFASLDVALPRFELAFDCVYFSILNFSFFGYGDILPQTIPAKLVTLTEITLAFLTVIFILSDFISLKDSLRERRG